MRLGQNGKEEHVTVPCGAVQFGALQCSTGKIVLHSANSGKLTSEPSFDFAQLAACSEQNSLSLMTAQGMMSHLGNASTW